jgi:multiple sugar transport system ATP-binding protein
MNSVELKKLDLHFGSVEVLNDLNLEIEKGEFLVLLGSSGCGKSTLLNCIAGLLEITNGQIFIEGKNVTWSEPSERGIGMVFQSYALYPQMTVEGNLSFGLKNAKLPKDEIQKRVARAAEILQIEPLLKRKPSALSGGQRQRVAIGRALVRDVDVFLFDEPLSNLDAKLRADLRIEIKQLHQKLHNTMIYVTHDQIEAMTLADRIAIMKGGKILQLASPDEIYNKPKVKYVAEFIGSPTMNFMNGSISSNQFTSDLFDCALDDYESDQLNFSGEAILGVRAEHILSGESASLAQVQLKGSVELLEPLGSDILARVNVDGSLFWVRLDGHSNVSLNQELTIGFGTENIHLFDAVSEQRI